MLGFVRWNVDISNSQVKAQDYKSLVQSILEYRQTIWDSYTASASKEIESVQRRSACYAPGCYCKTSSVTAILVEVNWKPLSSRQHIVRIVLFYKIHYCLVAVPMPLGLKHHSNTMMRELTSIPCASIAVWLSLGLFFPSYGEGLELPAQGGHNFPDPWSLQRPYPALNWNIGTSSVVGERKSYPFLEELRKCPLFKSNSTLRSRHIMY